MKPGYALSQTIEPSTSLRRDPYFDISGDGIGIELLRVDHRLISQDDTVFLVVGNLLLDFRNRQSEEFT